jgi:ribosomal protein L13E
MGQGRGAAAEMNLTPFSPFSGIVGMHSDFNGRALTRWFEFDKALKMRRDPPMMFKREVPAGTEPCERNDSHASTGPLRAALLDIKEARCRPITVQQRRRPAKQIPSGFPTTSTSPQGPQIWSLAVWPHF